VRAAAPQRPLHRGQGARLRHRRCRDPALAQAPGQHPAGPRRADEEAFAQGRDVAAVAAGGRAAGVVLDRAQRPTLAAREQRRRCTRGRIVVLGLQRDADRAVGRAREVAQRQARIGEPPLSDELSSVLVLLFQLCFVV
jgi:hypothetical protein